MIIGSLTNDQLEQFLEGLTPQTAIQLIQLIETGREKGKDNPLFEDIMLHARTVLREAGLNIDRLPTVKRLFCRPFESLLVSGKQFEKYKGRINRSSIQPVWEWLYKTLLADELPQLGVMLEDALRRGEKQKAVSLREELYHRTSQALFKAIGHAEGTQDGREKRLLGMQLGSDNAFEDAREMAVALALANEIARLKRELPESIHELDGAVLDMCIKLYFQFLERAPANPEIFLSLVMSRLKNQAQILRIAKKIVLKDDDVALAASKHSAGGEMILSCMEAAVYEINVAIRQHEPAVNILQQLRHFHTLAKGFTSEIRINMKSPWAVRLVEARKQTGLLLEQELAPLLRLVRKALLGRGSLVKTRNSQPQDHKPDPESLIEAERTLKILMGSQFLGEQLSVSVKINQHLRENKQLLEQITERNIAQIKSKSPETRAHAMQSLKASLSLIRIMQGDQMAELVWRRGQAASAMAEDEARQAS